MTMFKCDGRTVVWRQNNERFCPPCLQLLRPQNRVGIMFWGCIGFGGRGHLVETEGNMNRHAYIDILQNHLMSSAEEMFGEPQPNFIFQQDNAPPHTAGDTIRWLEQQPCQHLQWPANSPDFRIIETVWGNIMTKLRSDPPLTVPDLRNRVRQHWNEITPQYLQRLYNTISRRVAAVRRVRGYPTKY